MIEEHNKNIIMMLQSKLAETSMTFKDVLELRTQVRYFVSSSSRAYADFDEEHERFQNAD